MRQQAVQTASLVREQGGYAEPKSYETALAELEDMQRQIVRSAKAGMIRERRAAERKFELWRSAREARRETARRVSAN